MLLRVFLLNKTMADSKTSGGKKNSSLIDNRIMNLDFILVYRIPPFFYLHVLDQNTNVTRLEVGPKTFVKQDHEKVILGPEKMLIIPYVQKLV